MLNILLVVFIGAIFTADWKYHTINFMSITSSIYFHVAYIVVMVLLFGFRFYNEFCKARDNWRREKRTCDKCGIIHKTPQESGECCVDPPTGP